MGTPLRIIFVCLGNICRSPLAEGVFKAQAAAAGLADHFELASAGTSGYHVGELPDPGSIKVARKHNIDITDQRSQRLTRDDLEHYDLIVAMDRSNRRNIIRMLPGEDVEPLRGRLWLMRNFEFTDDGSGHDDDVPDPWGGGLRGFDQVYGILDRSCANLLTWVRRERGLG